MGISLAALLVMSVFFTGVLMMYRTTLFGNLVVSEAIDRSNEMWLERSETLITVEGAVANPPGRCTININLKNSGIRPVHNYQNMDLIVHFQSNPPEPIRLDYSDTEDPAALAPDNWTLIIDIYVICSCRCITVYRSVRHQGRIIDTGRNRGSGAGEQVPKFFHRAH